MCRSIKTLRPPFTEDVADDDLRAAALQYVRKVAGSTNPSQRNQAAFDRAVDAVTAATEELLAELVTAAPPKDRETEAAKARERAAKRYAS